MSVSSEYSQHVPAADRALRVLELVAGAREGITSSAILEQVGGSRSGLYALVNTLRARGYLVTRDGAHTPGPAMWSLIPARPIALDTLIEAFRDATEGSAFEETTALSWSDGEATILAAETPGSRTVRAVYDVGARRPSSAADARVLAAGDPKGDPSLDAVRQEGSCIVGEDDVVEIAAPVCHDGIHPVAAVMVGIPVHRATEEVVVELVDRLRRTAARLSYRVGASVYKPYDWSPRKPMGPSAELSPHELAEFLDGLWSAQLACVRPDGAPHVVPLWYEWDGGSMWFAASPGSSWRSYISDNDRVSMTLDEPWPPLRRAFISGVAEEVDDDEVPGGLGGLRRRLAVRYLGRGADRRPELTETEGWAAIRVRPDRMHGRQGLGPGIREAAS